MTWPPYPEYNDSGIDWLGEIPRHWEVKRLKDICEINNEALSEDTAPRYEMQYLDIATVDSNSRIAQPQVIDFQSAPSRARRIVRYGDTIVSTVRTYLRAVAHLPDPANNLIVSTGFAVLRPRSAILPKFLFRMIQSSAVIETIVACSQGVVYPAINQSQLSCVPVWVAPLPEQRAIASFLDRETAKIDVLIAKKERLIELLREKRAALIHDAVRDASTQTMRIGHVADQIFRPIPRRDDDVYIPVGLYNRGRGIFPKEPTIGADLGDSNFFWIENDDLILSGQFAWEGAVAVASEEEAGCVVSHRYPIIRGKPNLMETAYLFAFSRGAAGRNRPLNAGTLLKEPIPVPPMEAQACVSNHVYSERKIERIIARSVQLLEEYRTALISAAVTGKIDVREAFNE